MPSSSCARTTRLATLYNMVGFQTKLRHGEQTRIFRMIPGLERAEFARLGGLHRNTFINSPRLLDGALRLKAMPRLRFAGQITGVEGYVESAAIGLLAGRFAACSRLGRDIVPPPETTALGALLRHITGGAESRTFQPMNINFGLFPPLSPDPGRHADRKALVSRRALADLAAWLRRRGARQVTGRSPGMPGCGEPRMHEHSSKLLPPAPCSMASHIALEETGTPYGRASRCRWPRRAPQGRST